VFHGEHFPPEIPALPTLYGLSTGCGRKIAFFLSYAHSEHDARLRQLTLAISGAQNKTPFLVEGGDTICKNN
jgi:hypothetical protein